MAGIGKTSQRTQQIETHLQDWDRPSSSHQEAREVMDIRQAARYLGISPDSLYKYASENYIPAFKLGNRWRFKRSLVEAWMERQSLAGPTLVSEKRVRPKQKKPAGRAR